MRKRIIPSCRRSKPDLDDNYWISKSWVGSRSSEDPEFPISPALRPVETGGAHQDLARRPSAFFSHNRKPCAGSSWSSSNLPLSAHKSSSCAGLDGRTIQ